MNERTRCPWVPAADPLYAAYHDKEWGVPVYADRKLFEFIVLESAQAGLNWRMILAKRAAYKKAFAGFDPRKVARFTERDAARLMRNPDIVRNGMKIRATIANARAFCAVQKEFGSFARYAWKFVNNVPVARAVRGPKDYRATSPESAALAHDMRKRGFRFFGPVIAYSHMQATGMVNDHAVNCFRRKAVHKLVRRMPAAQGIAPRPGNVTIRKSARP